MNKEEYISEIKTDIENLLKEYKLNNYKNQAFAWKLNQSFKRTFQEEYLWNRALFLSTNCCILLQNKGDKKTALKGLHESATIFEYLSELPKITDKYDKDYLLILSALCYDLAGYQANAYCISSRIRDYELITEDGHIDLLIDNYLINQIRLILLKKIPHAFYLNRKKKLEKNIRFRIVKKALNGWYEYILKLKDNDYIKDIENAYKYFLYSGNTYLSHLIFLLNTRILLFEERSIWNRLKQNNEIKTNHYWKKYVKLLAYDYYTNNSIKEIEKRKSIFEFWTSQLRAIEKGLLKLDENFVVQMPTSAGKTFIAELSILKYLIKYPDKKCIYVAPFRALTSEKEVELSKYFSKLGFSVSSLSGSYEIDEFQDVIISGTDLLIATPEKIDLLLRLNPDFFNNVSFIVIDEGHIIGDISTRASLLEFLIIRLRIKIPELKTLFISAVMPPHNADEYSLWLSGKKDNVLRSLKFSDSDKSEEWEPTRKLISSFHWDGNNGKIVFENIIEDEKTKNKQNVFIPYFLREKEFGNKYPDKENKPETTAALAYKLSITGNTLVFCAQPRQTELIYKRIKQIFDNTEIPDWFKPNRNKVSYYYSKIWYGKEHYITKAIKNGIGIHFGDMPEQVRNSVESDFREGWLRVLISSNTIGQGLNFPIKNLIFYSLQMEKNKYIDVRNFWNIVGRAGRAGTETEGQIVFVSKTLNDKKLYKKYIDKRNIEDANSLIFKILDALGNRKIDTNKLYSYLNILSATYLLDLLTEEIIGTEYEEIIEKIIKNSLFKVQIDKRKLDIEPLKQGFRKIFKSFEENTTPEELNAYRITGFSFKSNKIIDEFIEDNIAKLQEAVDNDYFMLIIKLFLKLLSEKELNELYDNKLKNLDICPNNYFKIIENWVKGTSIQRLIKQWKEETGKEVLDFHVFISKALYYLYPWGISSFLIILSYKLSIEFNNLPENIKNLTSYLKYGLNNPTSCLSRSLGIKSRQVSLFLYKKSNYLKGKEFIRWLSNLTDEEIESFELNEFDKENLKTISLRLIPNSYRTDIDKFIFFIKGISFNSDRRKISKKVKIGEKLNYLREENNKFDPYAIFVLKEGDTIGYVPREYSKLIASEIDIEETKYDIIVTRIIEKEGFNEIEIEMTKGV